MKIKLIKIVTKVSVFSLIGLLFNIFMTYKFLSLWIHPQLGDIEMIKNLIILMLFEFFMIHAGLFMSTIAGQSWKDWLYGVLFFGLSAVAYNSVVSNNFILIIYCSMVLNRTLSGILKREETNVKKELSIAAFYTMIYIGLLIVIAFCSPFIPKFGLTNDFLKAEHYIIIKSNDDLLSVPHVAMCFGAMYYLIFTFVEMNSIVRSVRCQQPTGDL